MKNLLLWRRVRAMLVALVATAVALLGLTMPASADTTVANIDPNASTSLTIHKYEQPSAPFGPNDGTEIQIPAGANPLSGVEFTVQRVTTVDLLTNEGWTAAQGLDAVTIDPSSLGPAQTVTTDANGTAVLTGLPIGLYLVTETGTGDNPVASKAAPVLVAIPQPNNGNWLYDVHIYPKNVLTDAPVKAVDETEATALGDIVKWTVTSPVPVLQEGQKYEHYTITDQLDSRLDYVGATVALSDGQILTEGTDYTVAPAAATPGGPLVTIKLTAAGLAKLDALTAAGQKGSVIVTLTTNVNQTGVDGIIPNKATVWVNTPDSEHGQETNTVDTKWGSLLIIKHEENNEDNRLVGAEFDLFEENADGSRGDKVEVAGGIVTDANGEFRINPLKPGKYILVETKAPAGFAKDDTPRHITVSAGQETVSGNTVKVPNGQEPAFELPLTGGSGTTTFLVAGLILLAVAGGGYLVLRRRNA